LNLDGASVLAFGLADGLDAYQARHASLDARVVAQDHLGGAQAVQVRRAETKTGLGFRIGPEGGLHLQAGLDVVGGPLGGHWFPQYESYGTCRTYAPLPSACPTSRMMTAPNCRTQASS